MDLFISGYITIAPTTNSNISSIALSFIASVVGGDRALVDSSSLNNLLTDEESKMKTQPPAANAK